MVIGYVNYAPAKVTFKPDDGSITTFRKMTFYVLQDENKLVDCFTLNVVSILRHFVQRLLKAHSPLGDFIRGNKHKIKPSGNRLYTLFSAAIRANKVAKW